MPDESKSVGETLAKTLSSPGDYAAFLLGTAGGVVVDILSVGTSLAQGTLFGGTAALGAKKLYDSQTARSSVLKECKETQAYYMQIGDKAKADKIGALIQRAEVVTSMKAAEIKKRLDEIAQ
ncbi:MAG: hypothetical protein AB7S70_00415 [Hyphomicrobium sp.]|uniref:hypothetical protein n=1 Tax=Hyphomicrobium sp. TaxID=82 RepID=UPI003D0CD6EB